MERSSKIQSELNEISEVVAGVPFTNVFSVPENYFEGLTLKIEDIITTNKNELLLISENKEAPNYQIPANYFEELPQKILTAIHNDKVRVVNFRLRFRNIAIAACTIGILGFAFYTFFPKNDELKLDNNTAQLINQANQILKNKNLETEINKLSEDDLIKFAEDNGQDVEAALVASLSDEIELSDNDFYFYEDQSLHQYLTEHNIYKNNINNN